MASQADIQRKLDGPALAPPPGVRPNFINPANFQVVTMGILALTISISTLGFWIRMYTKLYIFRETRWEDYISLLAWLMSVGYCVPCILVLQTIGGVHQWNVRLKDMATVLYLINISLTMYVIVIALVKLSLLLQYLRVFVPIRNYSFIVIVTYLVIWSHLVFYLINLFFGIFACSPREKFWNRSIDGHCFNIDAIIITSAAINCISDFVILLLPQGVIWRLQMPLRRKLGISAIFLTGFFACIISVIRVYYSVRVFQTKDVTYYSVILGLWSHAEITFGILCGCLPVLPKFISALRQKTSMHWKPYVQIRTIFQRFSISRFSGKRGDAGSSECTGNGPYDFQGKWNSDEVREIDPVAKRGSVVTNSAEARSLAPTVGDSTTNLKCGEEAPSTNRIVKPVLIETVQEPRDDPDLDVEMQRSFPAW